MSRSTSAIIEINPRISREDIERLCILYAVGPGCSGPCELAERLGLSLSLCNEVIEAILPLENTGMLESVEGRILLTEVGSEYLTESLAQLQISVPCVTYH
jgi:hypothetical protein